MRHQARRFRFLTRSVLCAVVLWPGLGATTGLYAQVSPQPLGPEVLLRLPELQAEIRRQKFIDIETNTIFQRNEIMEAGGQTRLLSDEEVRQLVLDDARRYRERVGAIQPRFYDLVRQAAAANPMIPLPVVAVARFDPTRIPPGPSLDESRRLSDELGDEQARQRADEIGTLVLDMSATLAGAIQAQGGTSIRPSRLAPLVYADMLPGGILALARRTDVVGLLYGGRILMTPELDTSTCSVGATTVQARGVSGGEVEAAVLEANAVDPGLQCVDVFSVFGDGSVASHPTGVAGIIASSAAGLNGVAPGANIISADIDSNSASAIDEGLQWALGKGADVYNMSFGTSESGYIEIEDLVVDWFVRHMRRTVAKSAGNTTNTCPNTNEVTSPGLGFNMITVGNYNDMGSCAFTDGGGATDAISSTSCFGDPWSPHGDREKPEVAAPGTSITTLTVDPSGQCAATQTGSGTSFAAPHVTGAAALLIGRDVGLKTWPEAMKAILMASAFDDVDPGTTEKDGAGGIDVAAADDIVRKGRYDAQMVAFSDFDADSLHTVAVIQIQSSVQRLRATIAWDSNPGDENAWSPNNMMISDDFDLLLYKSTGELVGESASWDNSFELIDVPNPEPGFYDLKVRLGVGILSLIPSASEYLGIAWGVIDPCLDTGGDGDNDGVCTNVDNCPGTKNPGQANSDADAFGDACDNCPFITNPGQENLDYDSKGDACDDDDDNDGCKDGVDEHPHSPVEVIGTWFGPLCNPTSGVEYGFEGVDSDNDGILNCAEVDDDGDRIPDGQDVCPTMTENEPFLCSFFKDCPGAVWWDVCQFGGCNEFLIKVVAAINPDPTKEVVFDRFQIVGQRLYLAPLAGQSLAVSADAIGGTLPIPGGQAAAGAMMRALAGTSGERLRMEIWTRPGATSGGQFVALVAEYDPGLVQLGPLDLGALLLVTPPDRPGSVLRVDAAWAVGAPPGPLLADLDGDLIPDPLDNCERDANQGQEDADRDGAGDGCDCARLDGGVFAVPGEVSGLFLDADQAGVSWDSAAGQAGPATVYDLVRGALGQLPVGTGGSETCLGPGISATTLSDPVPVADRGGVWYLVRGRNVCGTGPYGFATGGAPQVSAACP